MTLVLVPVRGKTPSARESLCAAAAQAVGSNPRPAAIVRLGIRSHHGCVLEVEFPGGATSTLLAA